MKKRDLKFLFDTIDREPGITAEDLQILFQNVLDVLRDNRGTSSLSEEEILYGNNFIMATISFSILRSDLHLVFSEADVKYITDELDLMKMGNSRN